MLMPENSGVFFFFKHIVCPQTNPSSTHMQHVCFCMCHGTRVEVRGQLSGVRSFLLWVLNSLSCQVCAVSARAISPALGLVCFILCLNYSSSVHPATLSLLPHPKPPIPSFHPSRKGQVSYEYQVAVRLSSSPCLDSRGFEICGMFCFISVVC